MNIRNIAIIAHVDHGKTTLVDALLKQSNTKMNKDVAETDLIMDSNELERERGITIFSKNASVVWYPRKFGSANDRPHPDPLLEGEGEKGVKINIIDTPGHADFGGEVERVLKMADGCLLLIDAKEGPMPQTRFVLKRALEMGLKIIVVVNKIDRPDARIHHVLDKTLDLFLELGASDDEADFPIIYSSGKEGKAGLEADLSKMTNIEPIFEAIMTNVPAPTGDSSKALQMLVTNIGKDNFKGRIATGRIFNGSIKPNQDVMHINRNGEMKKYRLTALMTFFGLERVTAEEAEAGDIVSVAGIEDINIGETIADTENPVALPLLAIEEPTIRMTFGVNTSPFAGKEGEFKTSRQIRERLYKEPETDTALKVADLPTGEWAVSGRGELHLAIVIERLRREGYEFQVSRPQVIDKMVDGIKMTPQEQVFIEAPEEYSGIVMQKMGSRRSELKTMHVENGVVFFEFIIATKDFFGYRSEFTTDTRGLGIINSSFYDYRPDSGGPRDRERGSLVASESGPTNLYGLVNIQDRGGLFLGPGVNVYKGQVVGQNARGEDMWVNVCKTKQLSNMRSKGDGKSEHFDTPQIMGLEDALEYVSDDELVEVTPKNIRIRKRILDEAEERRKRAQGELTAIL